MIVAETSESNFKKLLQRAKKIDPDFRFDYNRTASVISIVIYSPKFGVGKNIDLSAPFPSNSELTLELTRHLQNVLESTGMYTC